VKEDEGMKGSNDIEILISGGTGSGKSTLLHGIGKFLMAQGFNVRAEDDSGEVEPRGLGSGLDSPDERQIVIRTRLTL